MGLFIKEKENEMKRKLIWLMMIIFSLSLVGCGQEKNSTAPEKTEKVINIGIMPDVESIPFIIAEKNGYFKKEGVQVNLKHFKSAKDRDSALQGGKLDGVVTDVVAVAFAKEGGIDMKIISRTNGEIYLFAGKDSGIQSMSDLKGKSVGISSNTIMEYTLDKMLETAQMKGSDVQKTAIPQLPTRLEMLQGGKIDAAILPQPLSDLAIKNGAVKLSSTADLGGKAGAIAFTAQSLKDNPDEIKAIFRAYNEAVEYLQKEPVDNYIDFVIESQGFPAEVKGSFVLPQYHQAVAPDEKVVADVTAWMTSKELIKGTYKYSDLVDEQVLR